MIKIKKGLNLPVNGEPEQVVSESKNPRRVALLGDDYVGMRPTLHVKVGDQVKLGQLLFTDKKMEGVKFTSPGAGRVVEINRGEKRAFKSIVIELQGSDEVTFRSHTPSKIHGLSREKVREQLIDSGLWTALRARPFSKVADPATTPHSIFITAMDTNPLAPSIEKILEGNENHFSNGLAVLSRLTDGPLYLCKAPGSTIPTGEVKNLVVEEFDGPHPAGLAGTHIHFLDPVNRTKTVWYISLQDVIAFGVLFTSGRIHTERIISLAGPSVNRPRLVKTRLGASVEDICKGELKEDRENRMISGSVLSGRTAAGYEAYLGRYHQQISVLEEGNKKVFLGWMTLGANLYGIKNLFLSKLIPGKKFDFTTSTNGSERAIVPSGNYEKVMPLDILPTFLLRALCVDDIEDAEKLGALELDEEDLALCTFACQSKIEFGPILRRNLTKIEKEG